MQSIERFWMVKSVGGGPTRFMHSAKPAAMEEAERLAAQNPGEVFAVLELVAALVLPKPSPESVRIVSTPGDEPEATQNGWICSRAS